MEQIKGVIPLEEEKPMTYVKLTIADYNALKDMERLVTELNNNERKPVLYVYHGSKPDRVLKYHTENEILKNALTKNEVLAKRNGELTKLVYTPKVEKLQSFIAGVLVASGVLTFLHTSGII